MKQIIAHSVRIFVSQDGSFGSSVGIVLDEERYLSSTKRLEITQQLGFSETVFINKLSSSDVSIYSKQGEIKFASPLLGAAWFIEQELGKKLDSITCQGENIAVLHDDGCIWLRVPDISTLPLWELNELPSPAAVEGIKVGDRPDTDHILVWAWLNKEPPIPELRARTFAPAWEIPEEEANGSGSMLLSYTLGSSIDVHHGKGSYIRVINDTEGIAVGGLVRQGIDQSLA